MPGNAIALKTVHHWLNVRLMCSYQGAKNQPDDSCSSFKKRRSYGKRRICFHHLAEQAMPCDVQKHATLSGSSQKKLTISDTELNDPTASELRRAYLLASKSKTALIAKVILLERELENCEIQNGNLREKILSLQLPHL